MNLIQTLYIDPSKSPFIDSFGWKRPEYHLMSWALSCLQLQKLYGNVELYANSTAVDLLVGLLKLTYASVHTTHDDLKLADTNLWALPKIYTYSLQNEPFLHIDGDVFIFDKFSDALLQSSLIAQNIEVATNYYTSTQKQLMENFTYFPPTVKADFYSGIPIHAVNAGILGGNNIPFIKQYTAEAFKYINNNIIHFKNVDVDKFNVFFEQHLFYSLANEQSIPINFLFNDIFEDRGYLYLGNFQEVPYERTYLHLLGHYKRDEITCLQMASKLRELYPDYYYKIISIFQKNEIPLFTSLYSNKSLNCSTDFENLQKKSIEYYKRNFSMIKPKGDVKEANVDFEVKLIDVLLLEEIYKTHINDEFITFDKVDLKNDFSTFSKTLIDVLKNNTQISDNYIYGRDIESSSWYSDVFNMEREITDEVICKCNEISIIKSKFNWGGLLNKHKREGVSYYLDLELMQGDFYNLLIPEITNTRFSLFDIDDLEKLILDHLSTPKPIGKLLQEMQCYIEDDIIRNYLDRYNGFLIELIKSLVIKKAIRPLESSGKISLFLDNEIRSI
jgi:hypothetical protein